MKNERGFSLVEVVIAIALMGIVGVAFLGGLSTASKAIFIADERATAESLARSQMEDVKNLDYTTAPYNPGPPPILGEAIYQKITGIPEGYTIWSVNRAGDIVNGDNDDKIIAVPWDSQTNQPVPEDAGLQRIKLVIYHLDKKLFELADYKVDR